MQAYAEAKAQIWRRQGPHDTLALKVGDEVLEAMAPQTRSRVVWFAGRIEAGQGVQPLVGWQGEQLVWQADGQTVMLCGAGDVRLPGAHNRVNVAGAAALAYAFGVTPGNIRQAVRAFGGVSHRLEALAEIEGVRYINDTAATAPEAAIAALASFDAPIVLLAGGSDKQLPLDGLAGAIARRARVVVLLAGSATPRLQALLQAEIARGNAVTQQVAGPFDDFEQAVHTARELARPGDLVLLSPGCASFGMFRTEFHRGDEFRRIVAEMQGEQR
jgi:UDP-N-acetylmuramoylalanine--D-glutamate ligase